MTKQAWAKMAMLTTLVLATGYVSSCDRPGGLEVRTFRIEHLRPGEAASLIEPYVYGDREGAPGAVSTIEGAITVRETADNLERISRVLAEFDQPQPDTRLHFQLIEADGFTDSDASSAAIETELRKIFQFRGYRLAGETFVTATDGSEIQQYMRASKDTYQITGEVYHLSPGVIRLEGVTLWGRAHRLVASDHREHPPGTNPGPGLNAEGRFDRHPPPHSACGGDGRTRLKARFAPIPEDLRLFPGRARTRVRILGYSDRVPY